jgi:hypothetical protein
MTANNDRIPVEKKNGSWVVDGFWPDGVDGNTSVNFYAYSNGDYNDNSGTPYISFSMDENASAQHDLLVAKNTVSYNAHQGKVPLTFDHACAALAFNVKITNTLKTDKLSNSSLTINSIVLRNVNNTGRYYFGGTPAWQNVSGSAYYTLTSGNITVDTEAQALSSNYLFVIPQSSEATYLDVTYTFSGQKKTSATIPLSVNWEAGKQYTINIKLGTTLIQ